jgi:hypothetical protein
VVWDGGNGFVTASDTMSLGAGMLGVGLGFASGSPAVTAVAALGLGAAVASGFNNGTFGVGGLGDATSFGDSAPAGYGANASANNGNGSAGPGY